MARTLYLAAVAVLLATGCRSSPEPRPRPLSGDAELNAFAGQVAEQLEAHAWQELIAAAEPDHYRTQVVDHGMGEAQYIAELFGLHRVDNNIKRGERVQWSDLERIAEVELERIMPTNGSSRLLGTVTLEDGSTLALRARVARVDRRYVLTGGVG